MKMETLEKCFNERIDKEINDIVDTVEDRIQKATLTTNDSIITAEIILAFISITASSGRGATIVMTNSKSGEHLGITAPFENVSERNNTLHVFISNINT